MCVGYLLEGFVSCILVERLLLKPERHCFFCLFVFQLSRSKKKALQKLTVFSVDGFVSNVDSVSLNMECFFSAEVWEIWKGMCQSMIWMMNAADCC